MSDKISVAISFIDGETLVLDGVDEVFVRDGFYILIDDDQHTIHRFSVTTIRNALETYPKERFKNAV